MLTVDRNEKIKTWILMLLIALGIALDIQALIDIHNKNAKLNAELKA